MTGEQFRTLRKSNRITQAEIASHIGRGDRNSVYRVEHLPYVPLEYVRTLGTLLHVDLTKPDTAKKIMDELGIKAPPSNTQSVNWRPLFEHPEEALTMEKLLIRYRRKYRNNHFNSDISRRDFSNLVFQALERGELRQFAHGNGMLYVCNQFAEEKQPDSVEQAEKTVEKSTKSAVSRTKKHGKIVA